MFISLIVAHFERTRKQKRDRATVYEVFHSMVCHVVVSFDTTMQNIPHIRFGDDRDVTLTCSNGGLVDGSQFWTASFFRNVAAGEWRKAAADSTRTWVAAGSDPLGPIPLASLLAFALDPLTSRTVADVLAESVYNIFAELAFVLDDVCKTFSKEANSRAPVFVTRTKSANERQQALCRVAIGMWNRVAT